MSVGTNIRLKRRSLGWTQDDLAEKMDCGSRFIISKIESGAIKPTKEEIARFANILGTSVDYLMGSVDYKTDSNEQKAIGARIRNRRKELHMSQDELAQRIGISRSTLTRYEQGNIDKLPAYLMKPIADALEVPVGYLVEVPPTSAEETLYYQKIYKEVKDTLFRLFARLCSDNEFFEIVEKLNSLTPDQLLSIKDKIDF